MQVRRVSSMRQGRNFPAVAGLNGKLYAMGGRRRGNLVARLRSVEVYDVETNQWRPAKPLVINSIFCFLPLIVFFVQKQARSDAAAAALGGKIYVVGGFDVYQKYIYLYQVGGFDGANQLDSCERLNPRTGQWKKVGWQDESI